MKLPILAACLVAIALCQRGGTDECDDPRFNSCNASLGKFWKTDTSMIWKNIQYMSDTIRSLMTMPYQIDNYVNICNGFSLFYSCLGQDNINKCLGTLGFVGSQKSPYDAYVYEGFLADWRFKCGAGFYTVSANLGLANCTQNTYINREVDMQKCFTPYGQNANTDPANACTYAQTLMDCVADVYGNGPCRSVDRGTARWYGCQSLREYTNAQFSHCQHVTSCKDIAITEMLTEEYLQSGDGLWVENNQ